MTIKFSYHSNGKEIELEGNILQLHIAGWTGRDLDAVEGHIQELEALDITRPKSIPIFYSCAASLLTNNTHIEVSGEKTSGEVEPVLLNFNNRLFVGIGSDHTDRHLESISVSLSKQICSKPISKELWLYEEVAPHWDSLIMKSYIVKNGKRELYQQGCLELIRPVEELINLHYGKNGLASGNILFCGTVAVIDEIQYTQSFQMELEDPILKRKISHEYTVSCLPLYD